MASTPLSDDLATRRKQLAALPQASGAAAAPAPELSMSGTAPVVAPIRTNDAPPLSMSDTPPPLYKNLSPTDQQKYGGTQVPGTSGQKNVGVDGYTGGRDAYKLGSVANAGTPGEAIKKINEDQVKNVNAKSDIPAPEVRDGYAVPGTTEETGLDQPAAAKNPMQTYLDYLNGINQKMNDTKFSAEQTQADLMKNAGIEADQNDLSVLDTEEADILKNREARIAAQSDQTIPKSVYAGRISEIERQENQRLADIANRKSVLINKINTKNKMVETIMSAKQYDYEKAQETYRTQYSQAMQGINLFRDLSNDQWEREKYQDQKEGAAAKAQADAIQAEKDDARANLQTMYGYISDGSMDVDNMSEAQQVELARNEVKAGMPIGTFLNLANKFKGMDMKGQGSDIYDADGNRYMQFVMQDKKTGSISVQTMAVAPDYRDLQSIAKDEQSIIKGGYDITKAKQDIAMGNLDIVSKQLGITRSALEIKLKEAEVENIPIDRALKELDANQKFADVTYVDTDSGAFGKVRISGEFGAQYGKRADGSNIEATASGKNVGTDIAIGVGTPVPVPAGEWVVDKVLNNDKIYGNSVLVKNPKTGETLRLSHLSEANVKLGQSISGGAIVGKSGATGNVTGAHLDIEYKNSKGQLGDLRSSSYSDFYLGGKKVAPKKSESEKTKAAAKATVESTYQLFNSPDVQGEDGKVAPDDYKELKRRWIKENGASKAAEFDEAFYEYVNPLYYDEYGLDSKVRDTINWDKEQELFNKKNPKKEASIYDSDFQNQIFKK
jgi:murein DD-endopeptidase MepM/ murein hydrolase activator NlpD